MGTNYYLKYNYCHHCKRYETRHLGKQSYGWRFLFHWYEDLGSLNQIKEAMGQIGAYIVDEYDKIITSTKFWEMVLENRKEASHKGAIKIDGLDFLNSDFC